MNIYIGNLANDITEEEIVNIFNAYGQVESVKIIKDKFTGESRGFGFIEMPDKKAAQVAMETIKEVKGRNVTLNEARPQEKRFNTGRGFGANKPRNNRRSSY